MNTINIAIPCPRNTVVPLKEIKPEPKAKQISSEYHKALKSNLLKNASSVDYLKGAKLGLTDATIEYFGLGLSAPYERADGAVMTNAVVSPMRDPISGKFLNKSAYICIPGITQNPVTDNGWMKGEVQCYYSHKIDKQTILFICEDIKDVWRHSQALTAAGMIDDILIISSTDSSAIPAEWKNLEYWARWDKIYLGQDNDEAGDSIAERLLDFMGREAYRAKVPQIRSPEYPYLGKDWTDFWQHGATIELFKKVLREAPVASGATVAQISQVSGANVGTSNPIRIGSFSHNPIDINGAYANGHLYYPTQMHVIRRDEGSGQIVERLDTVVVRSDRTQHRSLYAPAPAGTPLHKRVLKLTDGTIIEKEPKATSIRTWSYESIHAYLTGTDKTRPLPEMFADIMQALKQSVWLPYEEDYAVLALTALVTYVQSVFEAVPLLLLNGPAGSGKSQTGTTMKRLCNNGVVIGQISAAAAARLIDETRGFVVLDDVEAIAAKSGKDFAANEFVQALKVSYNKHTAVKYWTNIKTMQNEKLDFFGVKLLSNTLGADSILGSRMIRIQTCHMPPGTQSEIRDFTVEELMQLKALQNELHTWAFKNVALVDSTYREVYVKKSGRQDEIAAPLRTMAQILGDPAITGMLENSLARQHIQETIHSDDPVEILRDAVRNLIDQGYETVTVTHIRLEMRAILDTNYGMAHTTDIPEWDRPEWIGRQLRSNDLVSDTNLGRTRIYGKNLRLVKFTNWIINEVKAINGTCGKAEHVKVNKKPEDFCKGCQSCPYRAAGCELQVLRMRDEARTAKQNVIR